MSQNGHIRWADIRRDYTTEDVERFPGRPERVLIVGEVRPAG